MINSTMRLISFILFIAFAYSLHSSVLPTDRRVDWSNAGAKSYDTIDYIVCKVNDYGLINDGITPNDQALNSMLQSLKSQKIILSFGEGNYLFKQSINLPPNIIVRGNGVNVTTLTFDLGGIGNCINISGSEVSADSAKFIASANKFSREILVDSPAKFSSGDWIRISQQDSDLVTSAWAIGSVGQIVRIQSISGDTIRLNSELRLDYHLNRSPRIIKIIPAENVMLECFKIVRLDNSSPEQTSNIKFNIAANCTVKGIESEFCNYAHIEAVSCSNLSIYGSYLHNAFEFGGNGRAYGVLLHKTTNESLVENCIFQRLRHSMIVQSGANANVFAYNYSREANWDEALFPANTAGDIVLHGNYPYSNLFEQNICQNIVIDNSHGANGPHNTFFRNRAELCGLFFSDSTSPSQNIIATEIPNNNFPYNIINYRILGDDQFLYGNNNKGEILPLGTNHLDEQSLYYQTQPSFILNSQYAAIGIPNIMNSGDIPAILRYNSKNYFQNICESLPNSIEQNNNETFSLSNSIVSDYIEINLPESINYNLNLEIYNSMGEKVLNGSILSSNSNWRINTNNLSNGIYIIRINDMMLRFMVLR